jgi:hypothetical protein
MLFEIGIENNLEGRSLAWVLGHPGCFAYGENEQAALVATPKAIADYAAWIESRDHSAGWVDSGQIELFQAESWEVYAIGEAFDLVEDGYEVNAWFRHDWKPLSVVEIERGIQLLSWSREDLLDSVQGLSQASLETKRFGERWSILGILNHVGGAEWWYLDRLGMAFPRDEVPEDPFERLEAVRRRTLDVLPSLAGLQQVVGIEGEFWSPRKMLRRAVWHERDHTQHIHKIIRK